MSGIFDGPFRAMKMMLSITAATMMALSLGFVSPGMAVMVCLMYLFFAGAIGRLCGGGIYELYLSFGRVCVCILIGLFLNAIGIPFFIVFLMVCFLIWVFHH